jgi:hypothetical protein
LRTRVYNVLSVGYSIERVKGPSVPMQGPVYPYRAWGRTTCKTRNMNGIRPGGGGGGRQDELLHIGIR